MKSKVIAYQMSKIILIVIWRYLHGKILCHIFYGPRCVIKAVTIGHEEFTFELALKQAQFYPKITFID